MAPSTLPGLRNSADVLIVGAGPVGLLLATELYRDGVDVLLVEQCADRPFFCKALGVTARSLEIFEDLGIADDAIDAGMWLTGITVFNDGALAHSMDIPVESPLPYGALSLAQFDTERLLEQGLQRHGGTVQYGWALTGFSEDADGVLAGLSRANGEKHELRCKWLVGCDGAHSKVRSTLGLEFSGGRYPQTFLLADVEVSWELPRGRMYRFNRAGHGQGPAALAAVPVYGSPLRYRLSMVLPEAPLPETPLPETLAPDSPDASPQSAAESPSAPELEEIQATMGPLLPPGTRLAAMRWSSTYRVSHRIVPSYSRGRVFLAGDAAHIHPPVGGQGMNTGLQDAHNLAWKLALAARGLAAPALLDSYSAERHPVGLDVVEQTSRALNEVIAHKIKMPGIRETQLLISYPDSPIVQDERTSASAAFPAPGDRAPDAGQLRRPFVGHPLRLRERLGRGRHVLVGYLGEDGSSLATLADMRDLLQASLGTAAGVAIVAPGAALPVQERLPVLTDAAGEFQAAYSARPGMAWLIRPDGHIAWASAAPDAASLARFLSRIITPPSSAIPSTSTTPRSACSGCS